MGNVHVVSFTDEPKFTVRNHFAQYKGQPEGRHYLTFTNMNDKVVQLDFSDEQWHRILDELSLNGGDE